jgi:hypothetical protein
MGSKVAVAVVSKNNSPLTLNVGEGVNPLTVAIVVTPDVATVTGKKEVDLTPGPGGPSGPTVTK